MPYPRQCAPESGFSGGTKAHKIKNVTALCMALNIKKTNKQKNVVHEIQKSGDHWFKKSLWHLYPPMPKQPSGFRRASLEEATRDQTVNYCSELFNVQDRNVLNGNEVVITKWFPSGSKSQ